MRAKTAVLVFTLKNGKRKRNFAVGRSVNITELITRDSNEMHKRQFEGTSLKLISNIFLENEKLKI
jgi:hypothetical protein